MADSRYLNPYTDFDITNAMNDAEMKGFGKGKEIGLEEGIAQGIAEGIAEGAQSEKLDTAKRMRTKGFDVQTIADLTQLPISEIEKL
ncbi:MAG: hypothetical protein J6Z01_00630 [Bacteroidales bacterium]|nr:hypothetical protein [Bacteroidales bacterium]